jgi:putative transposase
MAILKWCQETKVEWHYIAPGTLFSSLAQARAAITAWKEDYNRNRPHSSLGNITPSEFAMKMAMEEQAA